MPGQADPGFVLGGTDEVEATRRAGLDVAPRALLVQGVELEQRVVAGPVAELPDIPGGLLEFAAKSGHGDGAAWRMRGWTARAREWSTR
jgi:hypothetical protein